MLIGLSPEEREILFFSDFINIRNQYWYRDWVHRREASCLICVKAPLCPKEHNRIDSYPIYAKYLNCLLSDAVHPETTKNATWAVCFVGNVFLFPMAWHFLLFQFNRSTEHSCISLQHWVVQQTQRLSFLLSSIWSFTTCNRTVDCSCWLWEGSSIMEYWVCYRKL